jgi:hypothetical protein
LNDANDANNEDFENCLLLSSISGIRVICGECNYSAAQHRHESDGEHYPARAHPCVCGQRLQTAR